MHSKRLVKGVYRISLRIWDFQRLLNLVVANLYGSDTDGRSNNSQALPLRKNSSIQRVSSPCGLVQPLLVQG